MLHRGLLCALYNPAGTNLRLISPREIITRCFRSCSALGRCYAWVGLIEGGLYGLGDGSAAIRRRNEVLEGKRSDLSRDNHQFGRKVSVNEAAAACVSDLQVYCPLFVFMVVSEKLKFVLFGILDSFRWISIGWAFKTIRVTIKDHKGAWYPIIKCDAHLLNFTTCNTWLHNDPIWYRKVSTQITVISFILLLINIMTSLTFATRCLRVDTLFF